MTTFTSMYSLLAEHPELHVWVLSYGISHGRRMTLALHRGDYPRRFEVEASGCRRFRGELEGGPYRLTLETVPLTIPESPTPVLEQRLHDEGGSFELVCDAFSLVRRW